MQRETLRKLLSVLVDECGYEAVRESLGGFAPTQTRASAVKKPGRQRTKPNAISTVESLGISDEGKKSVLMLIARKYEEKTFMPNINHVRAFLEQEGEDITYVNSRQQVVSTVFKHLASWETSKLRELNVSGAYSPPKSLSVIAESIENLGKQNRL